MIRMTVADMRKQPPSFDNEILKNKEFAPAIYGLFRPRIEVVKKYGEKCKSMIETPEVRNQFWINKANEKYK